MKANGRKDSFKTKEEAISRLRSYIPLGNAELNLRDQIIAMDKYNSTDEERKSDPELEDMRGRMRICNARRRSIERSLEALDTEERKVLDGFFIHPAKEGSAEDLMEELGMEKTQVYRLRTRALKKFAQNMFGEI